MLNDKIRGKIERATVHLPSKGGQGIIVPNGYILTAAHCIEYSLEGEMALDDPYLNRVECGGNKFLADVWAVEPCSDIAILGDPDGQRFPEFSDAYEEALELIEPIGIRTEDMELFTELPAEIFTHERTWIKAKVQKCRDDAHILSITCAKGIKGGTSGGPVIDEEGRLFGIVSWGLHEGAIPRPHLALPVWIVRRIVK